MSELDSIIEIETTHVENWLMNTPQSLIYIGMTKNEAKKVYSALNLLFEKIDQYHPVDESLPESQLKRSIKLKEIRGYLVRACGAPLGLQKSQKDSNQKKLKQLMEKFKNKE